MHASRSLRIRLFILILAPLVLIASLLGVWRYSVAKHTADSVFDRALLSVALAVSRDVTVSGGDLLSPTTRDLITKAAGGDVFYHATGPAGMYVAGYSYPPITRSSRIDYTPTYSNAIYRDRPVRVLQLTESVSVDGLTGDATVTVWQHASERQALATALALRAAALMGVLLLTLAIVVWFGVQRGLQPLMRLEDAISSRSPHDLSTIKRAVPVEAHGIVATLNRLFSQLRDSMAAQQVFISEAAHQLRNPAAAVLSLAEAARDMDDRAERERRLDDLVSAARDSARVTEQLLSLERTRLTRDDAHTEVSDLNTICREAGAVAGVAVLSRDVGFELVLHLAPLPVVVDAVLLTEAIKNLIDNALTHGGAGLSKIVVSTEQLGELAVITVADDGAGLSPDDYQAAVGRFTQVTPGSGSGLGLCIAHSVAERHGGNLRIHRVKQGARLSMDLPIAR